jgi:hypothetical protein
MQQKSVGNQHRAVHTGNMPPENTTALAKQESDKHKTLEQITELEYEKQVFEFYQRQAKALCSSSLVPEAYRGQQNVANCLIALNLAKRLKVDPLTVMQSMVPIYGRPSWSSTFVIALLNNSGKFGPIHYAIRDLGKKSVEYHWYEGIKPNRKRMTGKVEIHDRGFKVVTTDRQGNKLEGPEVTLEMAVKEGWYTKEGSKWPNMPDLMGRYRAASFFQKTEAPELTVGLPMADELEDISPPVLATETKRPQLNADEMAMANEALNIVSETIVANRQEPKDQEPTPDITPEEEAAAEEAAKLAKDEPPEELFPKS